MTIDTREPAQPVPMPWTGVTEGRIVHVRVPGLDHCQPAIVVRRFGDSGTVNLQVFRDGTNDSADGWSDAATRWLTSIAHESNGGAPSWHWPERA